jgi:hypothetical protein
MKYAGFIIVCLFFAAMWAWGEVRVARKGGDVYDWTIKLSSWLKSKGM